MYKKKRAVAPTTSLFKNNLEDKKTGGFFMLGESSKNNPTTIIINGNNNIVNLNIPVGICSQQLDNEVSKKDTIEALKEHKIKSNKIAQILSEIYADNPQKAHNIKFCGSYIIMREYQNPTKEKHIRSANFCKHPLCPMCAWRYSLQWAVNLFQAVKSYKEEGFKIYHLILTRPNTEIISSEILRNLRSARKGFFKEAFGKNLKGFFEAVEITNKGKGYHPHLHIILVLKEAVTTDKESINKLEICWNKFMPSNFNYTILNLYPIKSTMKDIAEVCKYVVSPDGIFTKEILADINEAITNFKKVICNKDMQQRIKEAKRINAEEKKLLIETLAQYGWKDLILKWNINSQDYDKLYTPFAE